MSEKEDSYIVNFNLEINENIAKITSKIDDKICDTWKINKQDIIDAINFKNKLINYLEEKIKDCDESLDKEDISIFTLEELTTAKSIYQDISERIKSGKYE